MRTVKEVSRLAGVSVRTLHHYDAIGLLKPTKITDAGYRLYNDDAIQRLQSILMFRELQFSLKEIKEMLDHPDFDFQEALEKQIEILELQYAHIGELISFARTIKSRGVNTMRFDVFSKDKIEKCKKEVVEKWGNTAAYEEYEKKTAAYDESKHEKLAKDMMSIFAQMGTLKHMRPDAEPVQQKIALLQQFITENYYTCSNQIFAGLGEMYVSDERFKQNIDKVGGEGTAEFIRQAILTYCQK